jgi:8-oxo-dGTP pyrophosphatase MutT (NUDIX family)
MSALASASRKECTLLLLRGVDPATGADSLLLGEKKRGFGMGKFNGFGGKVDPGETLLAGALREMAEESGVSVPPSSARYVGHLLFTFLGRELEELHVHVFSARAPFSGEPVETEEMRPSFFPVAALPFDRMWPDDRHWMPLFLRGARFRGVFEFSGHDVILRHTLAEVGEGEASPCARVPDPATAVLVERGAPPQTAVDF